MGILTPTEALLAKTTKRDSMRVNGCACPAKDDSALVRQFSHEYDSHFEYAPF